MSEVNNNFREEEEKRLMERAWQNRMLEQRESNRRNAETNAKIAEMRKEQDAKTPAQLKQEDRLSKIEEKSKTKAAKIQRNFRVKGERATARNQVRAARSDAKTRVAQARAAARLAKKEGVSLQTAQGMLNKPPAGKGGSGAAGSWLQWSGAKRGNN
jgi:hypothetical protein